MFVLYYIPSFVYHENNICFLFTFRYQTNGIHSMESNPSSFQISDPTEVSTIGYVIKTALEKYLRFQWNCKQPRAKTRNSIYVKLSDIFIITFLWNYITTITNTNTKEIFSVINLWMVKIGPGRTRDNDQPLQKKIYCGINMTFI